MNHKKVNLGGISGKRAITNKKGKNSGNENWLMFIWILSKEIAEALKSELDLTQKTGRNGSFKEVGEKTLDLFFSDFACITRGKNLKSEMSFEMDFVTISMENYSSFHGKNIPLFMVSASWLKIKTDLPRARQSKANRKNIQEKGDR
jgi:hypothetical protein